MEINHEKGWTKFIIANKKLRDENDNKFLARSKRIKILW